MKVAGRRLAIALVHYPVLHKDGHVVTSALTNIDVHDLSRSARTYGCSDFFIVHPVEVQRELATRIVTHWTEGSSAQRIPDRKEALSVVRAVPTLESAVEALAGEGGERVTVWVTAAREIGTSITFETARKALAGEGGPILLVFGTGWGLAPSVTSNADAVIEPIAGVGDWNHLSVRAACAIALDRLRRP
ncbi:hypothetical protein AKJ09_08765 [Labilithrix luteola]|uniref:tRNA (guanine-N(1)-)-methyltransferase C-terminal domain-containing protein n=1 Tax=Labilithrix luteola TaxID=1391654 RepID=A0A0K1Q8U7_9BACT|nr:RNA methyltransferase [Labilithrix luteola]AKV02102.1 hypothetical protein AKJ09_08765 [Labilithrix luteola]